jgi:hypothetical protein
MAVSPNSKQTGQKTLQRPSQPNLTDQSDNEHNSQQRAGKNHG